MLNSTGERGILMKSGFFFEGSNVSLSLFDDRIEELSSKAKIQNKKTIFLDFSLRIQYIFKENNGDSPFDEEFVGFSLLFPKSKATYFFSPETNKREWKATLSQLIMQMDFHSHYEAMQKLGKGNFSSVFRVRSRKTGMYFAAKAFSKEFLEVSQKNKLNFQCELETLRYLSHDMICKMFESFETEHSYYLILELVDGGDLFTRLSKLSVVSKEMVSKVMRELLTIVVYMHSKGVIHRDLKPQNILTKNCVNGDFELRIVDFGLSARRNFQFCEGHICGTPGFIAPETFIESRFDDFEGKCDIFSLGVLLFIMLTGKSPFGVGTRKEILERNQRFKVNWEAINCCNKDAKDLVTMMMQREKKMRATAKECLQARFLLKNAEDFEENEMEEDLERKTKGFWRYQNVEEFGSPFNSPRSPGKRSNFAFGGLAMKRIGSEIDDILEQAKELGQL